MEKLVEQLITAINAQQQQQHAWMENLVSQMANTNKVTSNPTIPSFPPYNTSEEWSTYLERLKQHFEANKVTDEAQKRAYFLAWVGNDIFILLKKLFGEEEITALTFVALTTKLNEHFKTSVHIVSARFKFYSCVMKPEQKYSNWIADLRGLARDCNFVCPNSECKHSLVDEHIRDMIVRHTQDDYVRTACLQLENPSLEKVQKIAELYELSKNAKSLLKGEEEIGDKDKEVHKISVNSKRTNYIDKRPLENTNFRNNLAKQANKTFKSCPKCEIDHTRSECRFLYTKCNFCNKIGHIEAVCLSKLRSRRSAPINKRLSRVEQSNALSEDLIADEEESSEVNSLISHSNSLYYVTVGINGQPLKFLLDSGASISIIGQEAYHALGSPPLKKASTQIKAFCSQKIPIKGWFICNATIGSKVLQLRLFVVDSPKASNIFGIPWFKSFGFTIAEKINFDVDLINAVEVQSPKIDKPEVEELLKKHEKLFEASLGKCTTFKAKLYLKTDAKPKFFKPRLIPFALQDAVKAELNRLEEKGIIKPLTYSEWAAPIVVVPKSSGSIRICGDFKVTLNPQLQIEQFPIPRPEELFHRLRNGRMFSKIDLSDAYLQLELDEESKKLTVINTPQGLYQYERLAFGIASAPAIFQKFIEQIITGLPGCVNYLDDIIVTGSDDPSHLATLGKLFSRLEEHGLRCNIKKCDFFKSEVEYLGFILSSEGLRPSTSGVEAVKNLPRPKNLKELQSFLGKVNYYNRFIPNFSEVAGPLNTLRKKNTKFVWNKLQEESYQRLKNFIANAASLSHYRPESPLMLATDASSYGIGAVISHKEINGLERPIAFASKTLNKHEIGYSQLEKEALSIIFGVKKFHHYLYGRHFEIVTDHKPLVTIFNPNKKLPVTTLQRLQRWAILLMGYDYSIRYRPTNKHLNADALSRLPIGPDLTFDKSEEACLLIHEELSSELNNFPITPIILKDHTLTDPLLAQVLYYVENGWPESIDNNDLKPFYNRQFALSVHCGVLVLQNENSRVVVPKSLRKEVLELLHEGHWGIVRMKQIARRYCWWPTINTDIEDVSRNCQACQENKPNPPTQYISWPPPNHPWERIHIDFAGPFMGKMWLIVVDAFSKFPYVLTMSSITTNNTIDALRKIFIIEGLPSTIVSDNGTQFTSKLFGQFCKENDITHLTTAPFHPASNGEAERFVRTFKEAMKKACSNGENINTALGRLLITYRTTPSINNKSPAELLHGRQPRIKLSLMAPVAGQQISAKKEEVVNKFKPGDPVFIKYYAINKEFWVPGEILEHLGHIMFKVKTEKGVKVRHQNQIRKRWLQGGNSHSSLNDNLATHLRDAAATCSSGSLPSFTPSRTPVAISAQTSSSVPVTPLPVSQEGLRSTIPPESQEGLRRSTRPRKPPCRFSP